MPDMDEMAFWEDQMRRKTRMSIPLMEQGSEPDNPFKYFPFEHGESENLENYEPGGFHPVHLGDLYDDRYKVVHKLGSGGFSTVWLARDAFTNRWVAIKIVMADESPTYETRSAAIANSPVLAGADYFAVPSRTFWIDGPNGRHLCLVLPVLGPDLSRLSRGIYSRMQPKFVRCITLQAAHALATLHRHGVCHGDFTSSNIAVRLVANFDTYDEDHIFHLFGQPQTGPVRTYSGKPPKPHAPDYVVVPLDFCASSTNVLSDRVSIIDFDQSFTIGLSPKRLGTPAKYLAPEVTVGEPASPASDVWALGCAIFRVRSGDDLFFDYDTNSPADALRQIVKTMGELPEAWKQTRFDEDGYATEEETGEFFWSLEDTRPLRERVSDIWDEPADRFITRHGTVAEATDEEPEDPLFPDEAILRVPFPTVLQSIVWKPTAVCVDGQYFAAYSDESDILLDAFPKISKSEGQLLLDLLSRVFDFNPRTRITAEELVTHQWFNLGI